MMWKSHEMISILQIIHNLVTAGEIELLRDISDSQIYTIKNKYDREK